jgi:hypothetical protein
MPKQYGKEFRRSICERLVAGDQVSRFSEETGVGVPAEKNHRGRGHRVAHWRTDRGVAGL